MKKTIKAFLDKASPKLLPSYRALRDQWYLSSLKPQKSFHGFKLVSTSGIFERMIKGEYENDELSLVSSLLKDAKLFVNIGANVGFYALHAAKAGVPSVVFEPLPLNQKLLMQNIANNSYEDLIQVYPLALSNKIGISKIFGSTTGASLKQGWANASQNFYELIPTNTLDNVFNGSKWPDNTLVLMDVEGYELPVLEGAHTFLDSDSKINWIIEICFSDHQPEGVDYNPQALQTFELFWKRGYKSFEITKSLREVKAPEIEDNLRARSSSIQSRNFLFTKTNPI